MGGRDIPLAHQREEVSVAVLQAGPDDQSPPPPHRLYAHPDAPYTGEQLRKQVVSFEKVKLTNNEMDKNGQVMYKLIYHKVN